jgi:V/A-type H+-transporting ATPase subunit A
MREISSRLEEMPAEEGYPAYLAARIASFYERAGRTQCLAGNSDQAREGALSVVGAVSPPGGDLSDSVVQATLRVVKVFWSLDATLAAKRHFPAIDWLRSYSLYKDVLGKWFEENIAEGITEMIASANRLLEEEAELQEIVRLVGAEALSPAEQLSLETLRSIREDFLHQNAFHEVDTHTSMKKQYLLLSAILTFHEQGLLAIKRGADISAIIALPIREAIGRSRYITEENIEQISDLLKQINSELEKLAGSDQLATATAAPTQTES